MCKCWITGINNENLRNIEEILNQIIEDKIDYEVIKNGNYDSLDSELFCKKLNKVTDELNITHKLKNGYEYFGIKLKGLEVNILRTKLKNIQGIKVEEYDNIKINNEFYEYSIKNTFPENEDTLKRLKQIEESKILNKLPGYESEYTYSIIFYK